MSQIDPIDVEIASSKGVKTWMCSSSEDIDDATLQDIVSAATPFANDVRDERNLTMFAIDSEDTREVDDAIAVHVVPDQYTDLYVSITDCGGLLDNSSGFREMKNFMNLSAFPATLYLETGSLTMLARKLIDEFTLITQPMPDVGATQGVQGKRNHVMMFKMRFRHNVQQYNLGEYFNKDGIIGYYTGGNLQYHGWDMTQSEIYLAQVSPPFRVSYEKAQDIWRPCQPTVPNETENQLRNTVEAITRLSMYGYQYSDNGGRDMKKSSRYSTVERKSITLIFENAHNAPETYEVVKLTATLANIFAAIYCRKHEIPILYRAKENSGTPYMTTDNAVPHWSLPFGLQGMMYTYVTSPLRRLVDLANQCAIRDFLIYQAQNNNNLNMTTEELCTIGSMYGQSEALWKHVGQESLDFWGKSFVYLNIPDFDQKGYGGRMVLIGVNESIVVYKDQNLPQDDNGRAMYQYQGRIVLCEYGIIIRAAILQVDYMRLNMNHYRPFVLNHSRVLYCNARSQEWVLLDYIWNIGTYLSPFSDPANPGAVLPGTPSQVPDYTVAYIEGLLADQQRA